MAQEPAWPEVTIEKFPKEWMAAFTTALDCNDVGVIIFEEQPVDNKYVRLVMGVRSPFDMLMAGYWFGNLEITQAINDTMPQVMENVQKLVNKFTLPSES